MHADVGLEGFSHHRWRGRGDDITGVDAKWMLQSIHTNFVRLTHRVPMAQVEDLPEAMQHQVVGVIADFTTPGESHFVWPSPVPLQPP